MSPDTSKKKTAPKKLFIISPIGEPESEDRIYFDKARRHIIDPIAISKGYETNRADKISRPGRITKQVIERLRVDDLVVADLTRKNPNVFYELAVRHAVGKPVILMAGIGEKIPFDVAAQRVIFYDLDPDNIEEAKDELMRQISEVESAKFIVDSPIEAPISLKQTEKSGDQEQQEIIAILRNQSVRLDRMEEVLRGVPLSIGFRGDWARDTRLRMKEKDRLMYTLKLARLKSDGYKLRSADWLKESSKRGGWGVYHDFEGFHRLIERQEKRPEIFHDKERTVLWFIETKPSGGVLLTGWSPDINFMEE